MSEQLEPLEALTRIVLDAELAKLRRLTDQTRRRQEESARLGADLAARAQGLSAIDPADDLALATGQDARWQAWVASARKRLARETAEIASRREAQRKMAQRAFGQVEALKSIRRIEEEERRQRDARRQYADPDGPVGPGQ